MQPKVTVVVANYNSALFIREAIRSALTQTLRNIEIIAVDNCSTDGSYATLLEMARDDPRLRVYQTERNSGGPSVPRNIGIDNALGAWIAIMDSDDLMRVDRLETLLRYAEKDGPDIVADDLSIFSAETEKAQRLLPDGSAFWVDATRFIRANTFYGDGLPLGLLKPMIRATCLSDLRYYADMHMAEDFDLLCRLLLGGARMRVYPEAMYFYRKHEASISHRLSVEKLLPVVRYSSRLMDECRAMPTVLAALRERHQSILTALAFSELVDAIKARKVMKSAAIGLRHPGALRLLMVPLAARLRRFGARFGFTDTPVALK